MNEFLDLVAEWELRFTHSHLTDIHDRMIDQLYPLLDPSSKQLLETLFYTSGYRPPVHSYIQLIVYRLYTIVVTYTHQVTKSLQEIPVTTEYEINRIILNQNIIVSMFITLYGISTIANLTMLKPMFMAEIREGYKRIELFEKTLWNTFLYPKGDPEWIDVDNTSFKQKYK